MIKKTAWYTFLLIAILLLGHSAYIAFFAPTFGSPPDEVHCDMEELYGEDFISKGVLVKGGLSQSGDFAFSGKYSSKIDTVRRFGFSLLFEDVKEGDQFEASVMILGENVSGVFAAKTSWGKWMIDSYFVGDGVEVVEKNGQKWSRLKINYKAGEKANGGSIKFYSALHTNEGPVYLDDLRVKRLTGTQN